ncbi:MAG: hypothetical protein C0404_14895 [Verrucomicrobia bacterium]|nr:hypothetical protein [Verrucomicrobiota bacterium]
MARSERIAFVSPRFAEGATVGGAETLLKALALRAAGSGRQVTFLTTCAVNHFSWQNDIPAGEKTVGPMRVMFFPVDGDRDIESFIRVQDAISRGTKVSLEDERVWLGNSVRSSALIDHLVRYASEYDRVVVGPYLFGLTYFVAEACRGKCVLVPCLHDEPFAYLESFKSMFASAHGIIFNTVPEQRLASRLFERLPSRARVVGIGLDQFTADPGVFGRKHKPGFPYVIYSGRRENLKGTPLLLDYVNAFRARTGRDIGVVLTGAGEVTPPVDLAPFVLDAGFLPEDEKRSAMAGALAFCHPSVNESLGIVILESWLAGTPSLVNGRSEVLRYQCETSGGGMWFFNYAEFEEELLTLMNTPSLARKLGAQGRKYVLSEYSWDAVEPRLLSALDA